MNRVAEPMTWATRRVKIASGIIIVHYRSITLRSYECATPEKDAAAGNDVPLDALFLRGDGPSTSSECATALVLARPDVDPHPPDARDPSALVSVLLALSFCSMLRLRNSSISTALSCSSTKKTQKYSCEKRAHQTQNSMQFDDAHRQHKLHRRRDKRNEEVDGERHVA